MMNSSELRELDYRVGRELMGYTVYHYDKGHTLYWTLMDRDFEPVKEYGVDQRDSEAEAWADCPRFTVSAQDVDLVGKLLKSVGFIVQVQEVPERLAVGFKPAAAGKGVCILYGGSLAWKFQAVAETTQLALCQPALEARARAPELFERTDE